MRILFLVAAAGVLCAQNAEFGVTGGMSNLGSSTLADFVQSPGSVPIKISLTDGFRLGFRVTLNNWRFLGHEFGYAYNRSQLRIDTGEQGMAIHQGLYNFLAYATPEGSTVRPFAAGGGHFSNFTPPGTSAAQGGGDLKFGVNYGGGIKVRVSPMFAIRFDIREYITKKPSFDVLNVSGALRQLEISAGFSLVL